MTVLPIKNIHFVSEDENSSKQNIACYRETDVTKTASGEHTHKMTDSSLTKARKWRNMLFKQLIMTYRYIKHTLDGVKLWQCRVVHHHKITCIITNQNAAKFKCNVKWYFIPFTLFFLLPVYKSYIYTFDRWHLTAGLPLLNPWY